MKKLDSILALIFLMSPVWALPQWIGTGDYVIPNGFRVWSLKVAPDESVWVITSLDESPPVGYNPSIHVSTDEGETWSSSEISPAIGEYGWDIAPIDGQVAFAALDDAGMYQTSDGGQSWSQVTSYPFAPFIVHFFNENDGVAFGSDANSRWLSVTSDGGENWLNASPVEGIPDGMSIPDLIGFEDFVITFARSSSYDVAGDVIVHGLTSGYLFLSTDKGYNWERINTPMTSIDVDVLPSCIAVKDENTIMIAGTHNTAYQDIPTIVFTTFDGGENWVQSSPGVVAASIEYLPGTEGTFVAVGHRGFDQGVEEGTSVSFDGGISWQVIDNTRTIAMDFLNEEIGYGTCCHFDWWQTTNGQINKWDPSVLSMAPHRDHGMFEFYPNPAMDHVIVTLPDISLNRTIRLTDVQGKVILEKQLGSGSNSEFRLDLKSVEPGLYLISVREGEIIWTEKLVVN